MHSPLRLRLAALALLGLSALWLTACQPAAPRAANLEPRALLQLRFDKPDEPQDLDVITSEAEKNSADRTVVRATVKPLQVAQFDETHAVLLTDVRSGEDCHACPGLLGAYFYERDARGWRLTHSQDAFLSNGGYGELGKLTVTVLEPGHHAATLEWGSCWQGNCGAWLTVVSLRPDAARQLGAGIPLNIDDDGVYEACSALDGKQGENPPADEEEEVPLHHQLCHQIQSQWRFDGKRLLMDFTGRVREAKDKVLQPPRKIQQRAVYEVQADGLKLVEGENPIPGF